jgi:UDP-N-acetylglucosamine transferase subunit ALG13
MQIVDKIKTDDKFFITIDREDSSSKLKNYRKYYVRDTDKKIFHTLINAYENLKIIKKERPEFMITNGGGSALFSAYFGKMFGAKIIFIESFARINEPSVFGKMIYPIADLTLIQWKELKKYYKKGIYSGPVFDFKVKNNIKKNQIFVTVGSSKKQFNRLLKATDNLHTYYKIVGQIGISDYVPKYKHRKWLKENEMQKLYEESKIVICHAGTASIENALTNGCEVISMARLKKYGEHVDDHQLDILQKFSQMGAITIIEDEKDLENAITNPKKAKKLYMKSKAVEVINDYIRKKENK